MSEVSWYSPKSKQLDDFKRTQLLTKKITTSKEFSTSRAASPQYYEFSKRLAQTDIGIVNLITYIRENPGILKYIFDDGGELVKIQVDTDTSFNFTKDSTKKLCDMLFGVTELLKTHLKYTNMNDIIKVKMVKKN